MKKLIFSIGLITLVGAGCANQPTNTNTAPQPSPSASSNAPAPSPSGNMNNPSPTPTPSTPSETDLETLPAFTQPSEPIDDSAWESKTLKSGVSIKYPTKGVYAPNWSQSILAKDDASLRGNCYVALGTKFNKQDFGGDTCQTTTAFDVASGTRTDYFVIKKSGVINLFTITRNYGVGFDMNGYSATVDHILRGIE